VGIVNKLQDNTHPFRLHTSAIKLTAVVSLVAFAITAFYTPIHLLIEEHTRDGVCPVHSRGSLCIRCASTSGHIPHSESDHIREYVESDDDDTQHHDTALIHETHVAILVVLDVAVHTTLHAEPTLCPPEDKYFRQSQSRAPPLV